MNNQTVTSELSAQVQAGEDLAWLQGDSRFKRLITQGYIVDVLMNESQYMMDANPAIRQEALEKIQSVNYFRQYLTEIANIAEGAKQDLADGSD